MARTHPDIRQRPPIASAGEQAEFDVLQRLADGLPNSFDCFHGFAWSWGEGASPQQAEVDIVVVSPEGHLVLLEVKAGEVLETQGELHKTYAAVGSVKDLDVARQMQRHGHGMRQRLAEDGLRTVRLASLLVLPNHRLTEPVTALSRDQIIDAGDIEQLCARVLQACRDLAQPSPTAQVPSPTQRTALLQFLAQRLHLEPDVGAQIAQHQRWSQRLASGLAAVVPQISHASRQYVVRATAGLGKTQLALRLLSDAARAGQRAVYVCFNRPLADHMLRLAPARAEVSTFHERCHEAARLRGEAPDFSQPGVFEQG